MKNLRMVKILLHFNNHLREYTLIALNISIIIAAMDKPKLVSLPVPRVKPGKKISPILHNSLYFS